MASALENTLASLQRIVEAQTAAWEAAGCPPMSSTVDGESYTWGGWFADKAEAMERYRKIIAAQSQPARIVRSRGRA